MNKAVFLDRDGVINKWVPNLVKPDQFSLVDDKKIPLAIKKINNSGYLAIVVTNQPIISKGFCTFSEIDNIHNKMKKLLQNKGAYLDGIYICPHHPKKGFKDEIVEFKFKCDCRKPKPGLILKAARDYKINVSKSWIIGDTITDIIAGNSAGLKTILLSNKKNLSFQNKTSLLVKHIDLITEDLLSAVEHIILSDG